MCELAQHIIAFSFPTFGVLPQREEAALLRIRAGRAKLRQGVKSCEAMTDNLLAGFAHIGGGIPVLFSLFTSAHLCYH